MEWLQIAQTHNRQATEHADKMRQAIVLRDMAVRRLVGEGMSYDAIAREVGLSKSRVAQIAQRDELLDVGEIPEGGDPGV